MALNITDLADQKSKQTEARTNIVLEIDGVQTIFGSVTINQYVRIGDPGLKIGDTWKIGGYRLADNQSPYISFNTGSTTRLTQKLDPSRAQGSSVSQMVVSLIDKGNEVSQLVSPGVVTDDILFKNCVVSIGFQDSAYPQDYNVVFRGVVQQYECGAGYVNLVLSAAEAKKIVPIVPLVTGQLGFQLDHKSALINTLLYQNRDDIPDVLTVLYSSGGTAGSETVTVGDFGNPGLIRVFIQETVSTDRQIKKAVENHPGANQLLKVSILQGVTEGFNLAGFSVLDTTQGVGSNILLVPADDGKFVNSVDCLEAYVKIEDEIIKYETTTDYRLFTLTRGALGTKPAYHAGGLYVPETSRAKVTQYFRFVGNPMDIALKVMISGGPTYYIDNVKIKSFNQIDLLNRIEESVIFDKVDVVREYGVAVGDTYVITGSSNGNDLTGVVNEIGYVNDGTYIVGSTPFTDELTTSAVIKFKSQFNVLPIGMKMLPKEVDVEQHIFLRNTFLSNFTLAVLVEEEKNGKDWIEQQLYLPAACFSVPRKGQSSVAFHIGPLARERVVTLNSRNVLNANQLKVVRSTSSSFANTIRINFDYNPGTQEFDSIPVFTNDKSLTQIPTGEKNITINSNGLNSAFNGQAQAAQSAARLLNRYAFGAEYINAVKVLFGDGYAVEIGDVVAVDYADLQLTDFKTGTRSGAIRLMEVLNKTLDNKTGEVTLDLVNTVYNIEDRFGLISPSSRTTTGSTTTKIRLKKSYSTKSFQRESLKWKNYIGQEVLVHNPDWSIQYTTTIQGFDLSEPQGMQVSPALATAPGDDWIVCAPSYPNTTDQRDHAFWKLRHAYFSHQLKVDSGASQTVFTLLSSSTGIPYVGSTVRVHTLDYTADSGDVTVTNVTGLVITVNKPLGFIPNNTHLVDLIGFPDQDPAYRII